MILRPEYFDAIEKEIQRLFNELIYQPLIKVMREPFPQYTNQKISALLEAVHAGRVWYQDSQFMGNFNSSISKELKALGAHWNPVAKSWGLSPANVPVDVRFAAARAAERTAAIRYNMLRVLDMVDVEEVDKKSTTKEKYRQSLGNMQADFYDAAKAISIVPEITSTMYDTIASQWGTNLDLYIKGWISDNVIKLREQVQGHVMQGGRAEGLVKMIEENYGVSRRKAEFLARQETSLLMSKFQESRYADVGVTEYTWKTAHDERVRPDHKKLNGKVFSFSSPPVTDRRTGARNNPGEDFGCRCIAVPLVR
jgi:SPP1 gp7 family putative phage head morphogenesis protein